MLARRSRWIPTVTAVAVGLATAIALTLWPSTTAAMPDTRHLRLVRALPAIDSTFVGSPSAVSLWFSEPVRLKATSVKVKDSKGTVVGLGPLARDTADPVRILAKVSQSMAPGRYTVTWRAMGHDSHVVKGEYTFKLLAGKGR